eukprot:TRINITY_DN47452_c0_g1_i1.p1 TRINITY_DN47452_c0_g1~~TRINITY_DN47452_c0_g1_i1.p1  ORF type:complete len:879 (+),score=181.36 TRINITY_DN47452_c0_g1_i1:47-2683(+)
MDDLAWRPRLRILCLHGRCQTASTFERKLERVASKASSFAELVFVDGPLELPLQHGERLNTRGWWAEGERYTESPAVCDTLERAWAELGPFDGVLGFSEGAAAAVLCCTMAVQERQSSHLGLESEIPLFAGLRFTILAGAPSTPEGSPLLLMPSLHFASAEDTVVPIADSRKCAAIFKDAVVVEHSGGHSLPQRAEEVRRLASFLEAQHNKLISPAGTGIAMADNSDEDVRINQDQRDELEALSAIYSEEELYRASPAWPVRVAVRLKHGESFAALRFTLPPAYPQTAHCFCDFEAQNLSLQAHERDLMEAVEAAREAVGLPSVMSMAQAAQQWVEEHEAELAERAAGGGQGFGAETDKDEGVDDDADAWWLREEGEVDSKLLSEAERRAAELLPDGSDHQGSWARQCGAGGYGKPWDFVVGLVGKPSAGKSTLFNAATRPEGAEKEASMAPHPFTTIDPNVGPGWFAAPCPSIQLGCESSCQPEHGRAYQGKRRFPLLVKDVAGLVPGAYLGRGRGNAFLNDLCDADSLVHVVDASGRSDAEGVDQGSEAGKQGSKGTDPLEEVGWVRREIHLWIFCNVRAKWDSVRKKAKMAKLNVSLRDIAADRLFSLFTGYRASQQLAAHVYEAAGFSLQNLSEDLLNWGELELHLLVACFLRVRFPIVVALNKADTPEAAKHIARVKAELGTSCVAVSARSEWWLYEQQRRGHLTYVEGAGPESVTLAATAPSNVQEQWQQLRKRMLDSYGSTGVMEVLSTAVCRRNPVFVCPVTDFSTLEGLARPAGGTSAGGYPAESKQTATQATSKLRTMLMLRPMSTIEEVFSALKHEQMLRGDLVRAETMLTEGAGTGQGHVHRRDDVLRPKSSEPQVMRILTNKKAR